MTETDERVLLAEKAAEKNLTVNQLLVIIELADDLEMHTNGLVQPLNLRALAGGESELRLFGQWGWYRIEIHAGWMKCLYQQWACEAVLIHASEENTAEWEILRSKILAIEGSESEKCTHENWFDTCQTLKPSTKVNV
jgi:hypothetical protein